MKRSIVFFLALSAACTPPADPPDAGDPNDGGVPDAGATTDAGLDAGTTDAGFDAGPQLEPIICADVPDEPISTQTLDAPRGYHGLAINAEGRMFGTNPNGTLLSATRDEALPFVSNIGDAQQMLFLDDGDLVVATDDGGLTRISPEGSTTLIAADLFAYTVVMGPDRNLYTVSDYFAPQQRIARTNPETGETQTLYTWDTGDEFSPHGAGFDRTGRRLFLGTISDGQLYVMHFDETMAPIGEPEVFATGIGDGNGWHDAVAVDACGNMYVPDFFSRRLYRVTKDGEVSVYFEPPDPDDYPHGVTFGTGEHGWREDAIYVPLPYNERRVMEIVIGVPSKDYKGPVVDTP